MPKEKSQVVFPDLSEIDFEDDPDMLFEVLDETTAAIVELSKCNSNQFREYDVFFETMLPIIFPVIYNSIEHPTKSTIKLVESFSSALYVYASKDNFNPIVINVISNQIESSGFEPYIFPVEKVPQPEREIILSFTEDYSYLRSTKNPVGQLISSLIRQMFTEGFLKDVIDTINRQNIEASRLGPILNLFKNAQPSIAEHAVLVILPILAKAAIDLLQDAENDTYDMGHFLGIYFSMLPEFQDDIVLLTSRLALTGPVKRRILLVKDTLAAINSNVALSVPTLLDVKDNLISTVSSADQSEIIEPIYSILPTLPSQVIFTPEDLIELFKDSNNGDTSCHNCIIDLIPRTHGDITTFATMFLQSDIINPALCCALIEHTSGRTPQSLFSNLLRHPEYLTKENLSKLHIGSTMQELLSKQTTNYNVNTIRSVCALITQATDKNLFIPYISHAIGNLVFQPSLYDVLQSLTPVLDEFDSSSLIKNLSDVILNKCHQGFTLLKSWLTSTKAPIQEIAAGILSRPFTFDTLDIICFLFSKLKKPLKRDVLHKMAQDTVPETHCRWFANALQETIPQAKMSSYMDLVIKNLSEHRQEASLMIYAAALIEADFFKIGEDIVGAPQEFVFEDDKKFTINLLPFFSVRRIYLEFAHRFNQDVTKLHLLLDGIEYEPEAPLTGVGLDPFIQMEIAINKSETSSNSIVNTGCPILSVLQGRVSELFEYCDNDYLAEVLMLFLPIEGQPTNLHQEFLVGNIESPLDYVQTRLFPLSFLNFKSPANGTEVLQVIGNSVFDEVSSAAVCSTIHKFMETADFSADLIRILLLNDQSIVRRAAARSLPTDRLSSDLFVSLLPLTKELSNRPKSKEFFETISKFSLPAEVFSPVYSELEQYEKSYDDDPDTTFIELLSLIPKTPEMIKLTLQRLFSPPTIASPDMPFVHTKDSWKAAFAFIDSPLSIEDLTERMSKIPALVQSKPLSSDFANKGRSGIVNLGSTCYVNCLMQIFASLTNFIYPIFSSPPLTPFVQQFRDFAAQLRFSRGQILNPRSFVETFPNFDVTDQEDVGIVLSRIESRLTEELGPSVVDPVVLQTVKTRSIQGNISSRDESKEWIIQLSIKGQKNLKQAMKKFFDDTVIKNYGKQKEQVVQHTEVTKWPLYLTIQLERVIYDMETSQNEKLFQEFDFPIIMNNGYVDYELQGVIVHKGDANSGHYLTIVRDGDHWFLCNDANVEYFSVEDIPEWCFGYPGKDKEHTLTGYLLFYQQTNIEPVKLEIVPDLAEKLNEMNEAAWPTTIFNSKHFLRFAKDLVLKNPDEALMIGFECIFHMAIQDGRMMVEFVETMNEIMNYSRSLQLFHYIKDKIGKHLPSLLVFSEGTGDALRTFIEHAFSMIIDSTEPINIIIDIISQAPCRQRTTLLLTFDLIGLACRNLMVNWTQEDELLSTMVEFVTKEIPKELQRYVLKAQQAALDNLLAVLNDVVLNCGQTVAMLSLFEKNSLNRISFLAKRSEQFELILPTIKMVCPQVLDDLGKNVNKDLQGLITPFIRSQDQEEAERVDVDIQFIWEDLKVAFFHKKQAIREHAAQVASTILPRPDSQFAQLVKHALAEKEPPKLPSESGFALFLVGLLPLFFKHSNDEICEEYASILPALTLAAPTAIVPSFEKLISCLPKVSESVAFSLVKVVHNIIALFPELRKKIDCELIFSIPVASHEAVNLLNAFPEKISDTPMLRKCIECCLEAETVDESTEILLELIAEKAECHYFDVPRAPHSIGILKFANALWSMAEEKRSELSNFMFEGMKLAQPFNLMIKSRTIKETYSLLKSVNEEIVDQEFGKYDV